MYFHKSKQYGFHKEGGWQKHVRDGGLSDSYFLIYIFEV